MSRDYWIFLIAILFLFLSRGEVSFKETFYLLFTQLFFIFIPGEAFLKLTKLTFKNGAITHLCAYAIGYVMSIVLYIILLMIGIQKYCFFVSLAYGIIMLFVFFEKRNQENYEEEIHTVDNTILLLCFIGALILGVIFYLLPNKSPQVVGYQNYNGDLTYWFKNCVAATKGYPLPELSVKDLHLYWHLFSCFEVAFLHFVTGIEIYNLCFTFSYIWKILLLVGGIYVLASYCLNKRSHILLAMVIALFTSALDFQTLVYYQGHLYRCSLAFEESYAMSMFSFIFFLKFMDMEKKNIFAYILTILGMAGTLGLKVSGGTILLAGIAGKLLFSLKKDWKTFLKAGLLFGSYCLVYIIVAKMFIIDGNALSSSTSSHKLALSAFGTLEKTKYYENFYQILSVGFLNKYIAYLVTVVKYIIESNYAVFVPLVICGCLTIFWKNLRSLFSKEIFPLIVMVLCGLSIFILFEHPGFSQVYFIFNTFAFAAVLAMMLLEQCEEKSLSVGKIIRAISTGLVIFSCYYNIVNYAEIYYVSPSAYNTDIVARSSGQNDVSNLEMTGLRWIRDNLPEDAVLVTNKVFANNPEETLFSRTFITSMFSERQVYLEGFSSTNLPSMEFVVERLSQCRAYYSGIPGAAKVLKNNGVTHAVVFRNWENAAIELEGNVIYENSDILVVELKDIDSISVYEELFSDVSNSTGVYEIAERQYRFSTSIEGNIFNSVRIHVYSLSGTGLKQIDSFSGIGERIGTYYHEMATGEYIVRYRANSNLCDEYIQKKVYLEEGCVYKFNYNLTSFNENEICIEDVSFSKIITSSGKNGIGKE